MIAKLNF